MLVEPNKVSAKDTVCRVLEVHKARDGLTVAKALGIDRHTAAKYA